MGHVNFLLCPSAVQFTDQLQPTAQTMPQVLHRGNILVKGHQVKVIGGKSMENLTKFSKIELQEEQKLQ